MLSIEMAKKLKEAGLVWNPDIGDIFFYDEDHWDSLSLNDVINGEFKGEILDYIEEEWLFAPRLDQLLMKIEKLGWDIDLMHFANNKDNTEISDDPSWSCEVNKFFGLTQTDVEPKLIIHQSDGTDHAVNVNGRWQENRQNEIFDADTPENAAASALLWIYEGRVKA